MEANEHGQYVGPVVPGWGHRETPRRVPLPGHHVAAEPISLTHTEGLFAATCGPDDGHLWTYRPQARPENTAELERVVVRPLVEDTTSVTYAFVPTGDAAAGFASFFPIAATQGVVEISGVLFGSPLQRTTAATEAIHLMLTHAFDLGYRRVEWKCDRLNEPSRNAAARFGFTYEGRFRQHMVTKNRNRDTDWFSILDSEWPELRARNERWLDPANFDELGRQRHRLGEA